MAYQIQVERKALKFLASVPKKDYIKLREHIAQLAEDPHLPAALNLQDQKTSTGSAMATIEFCTLFKMKN